MWYKKMEQQQRLLHFCDSKHPLVFNPYYSDGIPCFGCQESIDGPSYYCPKGGCPLYIHHKSCAELSLGLHHPLHPLHPLILFDEKTDYPEEKEKSKCQVCKKSRREYTYGCYRCNFNLHIKCLGLPHEVEFYDHPQQKMEQQQQLLHFCDSKHPLVYDPDYSGGDTCCGCQESVYGPSYCCPESECPSYRHHKSCAELPLGLHHPLHPLHPLILFDEKTHYPEEKEKSRCQLCKKSRREYTYGCYRCNFSLHIKCLGLQHEVEFHDHPHQ